MNDQTTPSNFLTVPVAIIIAGALIAAALYFGSMHTGQNMAAAPGDTTAAQPQPSVDASKVKADGEPFIGNANAPAIMAYFSDYQCPFCKQFEQTKIQQIVDTEVKTGKLKIIFKDFQFLGDDSQTAGLAARAVWEVAPDKYYDWRKAMFDKQDSENSGWGNKDDILALTKTISGIDATKVEQLMTSKQAQYQQAMDADKAEGTALGVTGTPTWIIGKQLVQDSAPYSRVDTAIQAALSGK